VITNLAPRANSPCERPFEATFVELTNTILSASLFRDAWPDPWQDVERELIGVGNSEHEFDADPTHDDVEDHSEDDGESEEESEECDTDENQGPHDRSEELLRPLITPGLSVLSQHYHMTLRRLEAQ
jgi:hypothetical protein